MSLSHRIMAAALAFPPLAATAQAASVDDANAAVPPTNYVSAFRNYPATPADQATPDTVWQAANQEVSEAAAQNAGHAEHAAKGQEGAASTPAPATTHPHAGHGSHHQ